MAIAPLPQQEQFDLLEIPWPKPTLRLVAPVGEAPRRPMSRPASTPVEVDRATMQATRQPQRRTSTAAMARRRHVLVAAVVATVLLVLALPIQSLGGRTVTGQLAPSGVTTGLPDGSLYVVQPGDTLTSIAHRINPAGDQAALVRALRTTVGSPVVVPGEHIVLP